MRTRHILSVAALMLATAVPSAAAKTDPLERDYVPGVCQRQPHEIHHSPTARYFIHAGALYGCRTIDDPADGTINNTARLAAWSHVRLTAFRDYSVAWTTRTRGADGKLVDSVHGAIAGFRSWGGGVPATFGPAATRDRLVSKLVVHHDAAAWVTHQGAVMLFIDDPRPTAPPALVGAGTTAAYIPFTGTLAQGLLSPTPTAHDEVALIGRWPATGAKSLGRSLTLTDSSVEDEPCGGHQTWTATVKPVVDQPRVGASWTREYNDATGDC